MKLQILLASALTIAGASTLMHGQEEPTNRTNIATQATPEETQKLEQRGWLGKKWDSVKGFLSRHRSDAWLTLAAVAAIGTFAEIQLMGGTLPAKGIVGRICSKIHNGDRLIGSDFLPKRSDAKIDSWHEIGSGALAGVAAVAFFNAGQAFGEKRCSNS